MQMIATEMAQSMGISGRIVDENEERTTWWSLSIDLLHRNLLDCVNYSENDVSQQWSPSFIANFARHYFLVVLYRCTSFIKVIF